MSRWTYIRGVIEFESRPFEFDKCKLKKPDVYRNDDNDKEWSAFWEERTKKVYLPYPEKQFELITPYLISCGGESYTHCDFRIYSLPRAQKYLNEAFSLLPQGECGWHPAIKQDKYDTGITYMGNIDTPCIKKEFEKAIVNLYKENFWEGITFKELKKYIKLTDRPYHIDVMNIIAGINESLRYCNGAELQESLEKFFDYLLKNEIDVKEGYLEWTDSYKSKYRFTWRYDISAKTAHKFYILDKKTNKILASKIYYHKEDGNIGCNIIESDNWDTLLKQIGNDKIDWEEDYDE